MGEIARIYRNLPERKTYKYVLSVTTTRGVPCQSSTAPTVTSNLFNPPLETKKRFTVFLPQTHANELKEP